jgi:hypothetical protein
MESDMNQTRAIVIALAAVFVLGGIWMTVSADTTRLDAATMRAALRTATPEENGFIDFVIAQVNKGKLPADLVDSTFQWARKKPYKHRFQYFRQALIVRAAAIGVNLNR